MEPYAIVQQSIARELALAEWVRRQRLTDDWIDGLDGANDVWDAYYALRS